MHSLLSGVCSEALSASLQLPNYVPGRSTNCVPSKTAVALTAVFLFMSPNAASATHRPSAPSQIEIETQAIASHQAEFRELEKLEPYVNTTDHSLNYDGAKNEVGADPQILDEYAAALISQGWVVEAHESDIQSLRVKAEEMKPVTTALRAGCEGRNGYEGFPPAILLNSCSAEAVEKALAGGIGVAGLAGTITAETGVGPVAAAAVAAVLAVQASLVGICNSWKHGIKIFLNGTCWSQ